MFTIKFLEIHDIITERDDLSRRKILGYISIFALIPRINTIFGHRRKPSFCSISQRERKKLEFNHIIIHIFFLLHIANLNEGIKMGCDIFTREARELLFHNKIQQDLFTDVTKNFEYFCKLSAMNFKSTGLDFADV